MNYHVNQKGFANIILIVVAVIIIGVIGYFVLSQKTETPLTPEISQQNQTQQKTPISKNTGFIAEVTGARTATISAPGIFYCIPSTVRSSPGMVAPSLLVLADNQGVRENGITFSIPMGKPSGTYKLATNPSPFPDVVEFQVRVELGSTVDYFNKNTNGVLTIDSIPEGTQNGTKYLLKGSFDFDTSNGRGELVKIKGGFDFPAPQDKTKYCQ